MSSVERLRFVIVLDLRILDRVDFDGMPSLRAMSAVVFGLVLSVGFGCTVKYGVFWTRDAKAKVLDVVLGLVLVRATVAAAISAAVGETVMSRAPPWESEVGRTPPELRVFGVEPPRGTGCTAPPARTGNWRFEASRPKVLRMSRLVDVRGRGGCDRCLHECR